MRTYLLRIKTAVLVPASEHGSARVDGGCATIVESHAHRVSGRSMADVCRVHPVTCQYSRYRVPSSRASLPTATHGRGLFECFLFVYSVCRSIEWWL